MENIFNTDNFFLNFENHCQKAYDKFKENKLGKRQLHTKLDWLERQIKLIQDCAETEIEKLNFNYTFSCKLKNRLVEIIGYLEDKNFNVLMQNK